jgi:hypothetical protein
MPIVGEMIGELLDAFGTGAIHVGMDEVFGIASKLCPRCRGKDPAELFARAVNDLHRVIVDEHHATMLMWGDRLLNAEELGQNAYTASWNRTYGAIDHIPKDIVICDWHYDVQEDYRSLDVFLGHGFQVWPAVYDNWPSALAFIKAARRRRDPRVLGVLATQWSAPGGTARLFDADPPLATSPLSPGDEAARAKLAVSARALREAWRPTDSDPVPVDQSGN